jgi:hypothetical protein
MRLRSSSPQLAPDVLAAEARDSFDRLAAVLGDQRFAGWDPYDALSSPLLRFLGRTASLRRVLIQSLKHSPVNLRPALGVPRQQHVKGLALACSAHARAASWAGAPSHATAAMLAGEIAARTLELRSGRAWGYDFDVQTRWGYYRRGEPNAVVTAFAATALLDAEAVDAVEGARPLVDGAVAYAVERLFVPDGEHGYFAYFTGASTHIPNASMLLAALVARATDARSPARDLAAQAVARTLALQRADGSWTYGEGEALSWVDGYHTAYILDALATWNALSAEPQTDVVRALKRGLSFYVERLFDEDGAPRATPQSRYPIDIHAAASAVGCLVELGAGDERAARTADCVLAWTLRHMRRPDGRFAFQQGRVVRKSVPYVRWSDGHMLLALARFVRAANLAR